MIPFPFLFSPLQIGSLVVRNRIHCAAHMTNFMEKGVIGPRLTAYLAERAQGGAGLITTEELAVHPTDQAYPHLGRAWDPAMVDGFRMVSQAVHNHGAKIFAQLNHNGMQANGRISRLPVWGPSPLADPIFRESAKEMEVEDIQDCINGFARSAIHVREGGMDGIELQLGHASLIRQFLSPATNLRQDDYGGSPENRLRFCLEVIAAVRRAVGRDFPLGVRLNADEMQPGGLTLEESRHIAHQLTVGGQLDFMDLSLGSFHDLYLVIGSMHTPPAYTEPLAAGIREMVDLPVFCTNRINDPHLAEKILANGHADMIGMVRALICDPELPNKARSGQAFEIRHCIACNQSCIGRMAVGRSLGCLQNPAVGQEAEQGKGRTKPSTTPKKVVVVGGGPAGLAAARQAALRHHRVVLLEKEEELGGRNLLAAKLPGRQEFGGAVRWLSRQVRELGIDIRHGQMADLTMVLAEEPEAVVVAIGARPDPHPFAGEYGPPTVVTGDQVAAGQVETGARVLVIDCLGHHQGVGTAELLADQGKEVHLITPFLFAGAQLGPMQDLHLARKRLKGKGVICTPDIAVLEIQGALVKGLQVYSEELLDFEGYDTVVLVTVALAEEGLYYDLKGKVQEVYRVGDCLAPRWTDMAIWEGAKIGRNL